jgi:hypothetical protein
MSTSTPRVLFCLCALACTPLLNAQTPPTAYVITQSVGGTGGTSITYRSGSKVLVDFTQAGTPASRSFTLYDLTAGTSTTWDPTASPIQCNVAHFSGDWGDPFAMMGEISDDISKGILKPSGTGTLDGIAIEVYAGSDQGQDIKAWLDQKDSLVIRVQVGAPNTPPMTMVDVTQVSFTAPPASRFALPAACAGVKPPPTAAELIAAETGDDPANWVNGSYGPGSANSCTIVVHAVASKTMAPLNRHYQAAIDTTYDQSNPPHYIFGVATDGTTTFSGGGVHEITDQVHNGVFRIDNPPAYFMLGVYFPTPNRGGDVNLVYRQCFGPVTNLYFVAKDPSNPDNGWDWLYAKSGKYAVPPAQ